MNKQFVVGIAVLLICIGLSGCIETNNQDALDNDDVNNNEPEIQTMNIGNTISEIGTDVGKNSLSMTLLSAIESNISVNGPYSTDYYTFTAKEGMKFITLTYELQNNWIKSQITPSIAYGEILTDKGYYYHYWNPPVGIHSEEYQPRKSTEQEVEKFIGQGGSLKELLPEETILGRAVFEIPEDQTGIEITLSYVPNKINIESGIEYYPE